MHTPLYLECDGSPAHHLFNALGASDVASDGQDSAPPVDLSQLASALAQVRGPSLLAALTRGQILCNAVLGANGSPKRERGKKCISFRALSATANRGMSSSSLWRAVAIYELSLSFPELTRYRHVGVGHLSVILGVPPAHRIELLRVTEHQRWTRRKLQVVAREIQRSPAAYAPSREVPSFGVPRG